jgi:hypothetical protein
LDLLKRENIFRNEKKPKKQKHLFMFSDQHQQSTVSISNLAKSEQAESEPRAVQNRQIPQQERQGWQGWHRHPDPMGVLAEKNMSG